MHNNDTINKKELHILIILSTIFTLRMLGIFMILPILTIYADLLKEANAYLIGIALGIYGTTQIIFQLPFGILSDKIGYKPVIIIGSTIFMIGSILIAITNNIWGFIIGRALQGTGAISSSLIALLLNSIRDQHQTKAMAVIGTNFGITFASSMILGPIIVSVFGIRGLLQIIAILAILAMLLAYTVLPSSSTVVPFSMKNNYYHTNYINLSTILNTLKQILINSQIIKLVFYIFCIHTILMLNCIALPKKMINLGFILETHWKIYCIVIIISACIILPYMFYAKTKNHSQKILIISTYLLCISELIMCMNTHSRWIFLLGIQFFFIAFNFIETILPTLINKKSPKHYKTTTISIYAIGQSLGVSIGGILGGILLSQIDGIWLVLCGASFISILYAIVVTHNKHLL